jgi:hypothetical protein
MVLFTKPRPRPWLTKRITFKNLKPLSLAKKAIWGYFGIG